MRSLYLSMIALAATTLSGCRSASEAEKNQEKQMAAAVAQTGASVEESNVRSGRPGRPRDTDGTMPAEDPPDADTDQPRNKMSGKPGRLDPDRPSDPDASGDNDSPDAKGADSGPAPSKDPPAAKSKTGGNQPNDPSDSADRSSTPPAAPAAPSDNGGGADGSTPPASDGGGSSTGPSGPGGQPGGGGKGGNPSANGNNPSGDPGDPGGGGGGAVGAGNLIGSSGGKLVPNLVGKSLAQATDALTSAGLKVSSVVGKGAVTNQAPAAGALVPSGASVKLTLGAVGPIKVPEVINHQAPAAKQTIESAKLKFQTASPVSGPLTGYVINQDPAAGAMVPAETKVTVTLGQKPLMVKAPGVMNQPASLAKSTIEAMKLKFQTANPESGLTKGFVVKQEPIAGASVPLGSTVTVTLGVKPVGLVKVPDVVQKPHDQAQAKNEIEAVKLVFKPAEPHALKGFAAKQDPPAGKEVAAGTVVTVTFGGKGGSATKVPDLLGASFAKAKSQVEQSGLTFKAADPSQVTGPVSKQDPTAGKSVPAGTAVTVTFGGKSGEGAKVKVPDLSSMTSAQAKQALDNAKLKFQAAGTTTGAVKSQAPSAGSLVALDTVVTVTFASPKPPRPAQVKVPDVRGRDYAAAQKALSDAGLTAQAIGDAKSPHRVESQTPGPGAMADRGAVVRLSMSK